MASPCNASLGRQTTLPTQHQRHTTASAGRGHRLVCGAAPPVALHAKERESGAATSSLLSASSSTIGAYPITSDWLAHSRQLNSLPLSTQDAVVEHLRRLLGRGDRWAWQMDDNEELCLDAEPEELVDVEDDTAEGTNSKEQQKQQQQPVAVLSKRGAGRRSGSRHGRGGQALAGSRDYSSRPVQPWSGRVASLPAGLQSLQASCASRLLSAEQEAVLGELVQAAKQAQQHPTQATRSSSKGGAKSGSQPQLQPAHQSEEELVTWRGAAAQQLLFGANPRLVALALRKLQCGAQLPSSLLQELRNAGLDALWSAAGAYNPSRHTRFSTYAMAAIQNGMSDVLAAQQLVRVPRSARALGKQVRDAMESLPQAEQHEAEEQQLEASKMAQLASQARLSQLQLQTGLAAARRQRIVSAKCCVPVVTAAGGEAMAQLSDIAESDEDSGFDEEVAEEAVQLLLSSMRHAMHERVLRMRFGLDASPSTPQTAAGTLDFATMGRELGVSRQRAQQLYHAAISDARSVAAVMGPA